MNTKYLTYLGTVIGAFLILLSGCVSKSKYGSLEQRYDETASEKEFAEEEARQLAENLEDSRSQLQHLEDQRETQARLIKSLKDEVKSGNVTITRLKERLTVNVLDKVLFDSGEAEIKQDGKSTLSKVSEILKDTIDKDILVYGHTDNVPIGPKLKNEFQTNWELSTARATSVVRYLAQSDVPQEKMMAAGHAEFRPIASNETKEGRQENRRIEIVLIPKEIIKTN